LHHIEKASSLSWLFSFRILDKVTRPSLFNPTSSLFSLCLDPTLTTGPKRISGQSLDLVVVIQTIY
ncbi:TPA: hypothetical protein ACPJ06_003430, partial [Vibrio diabolicus]